MASLPSSMKLSKFSRAFLDQYSLCPGIIIKSKFDEFRTTVGDDNSFRKKFRNAVEDYKRGSEKSVRTRLIIITLILLSLIMVFFLI